MAKIGLYADPHVSQTSSIVVGSSGGFSGRLDNLIKSFNWMRSLFAERGCDEVVCLGDMTDKPSLTAEELSAMSKFVDCSNDLIIVGNHCRSDKSGRINTLNSIFNYVFYQPTVIDVGGKKILLLPYNSTPEDLSKISKEQGPIDVVLSHNDIKGYDYGNCISTSGYDLDDILSNCKLFINGHLHNGGWLIKDRVVNLGQLSGMNFSSCGGQWEPSVGILDLDTLELEIIENPYAYRFKKESFTTLVKLKNYLNALPDCGKYVLQVKVPESIASSARSVLDKSEKVVTSRVLTVRDSKKSRKVVTKVEKVESKSIYDKMRGFLSTQDQSKFNPIIAEEIIASTEKKEGVE